ncbi:hypothetical protein P7K49_008842, partial [Saguinus oedipus]
KKGRVIGPDTDYRRTIVQFLSRIKSARKHLLTPGILKRQCCLFCNTPVVVFARSGVR